VAFTNFIPGSIGEGRESKPSRAHWEHGEEEIPAVLEYLLPRHIIAFGISDLWKHLHTDIGANETDALAGKPFSKCGFTLSTGEIAWCQPVTHPSWAKHWRELRAAIDAIPAAGR
jgi:hypothetical protein